MAKTTTVLSLRIERGENVIQREIVAKERFTIGSKAKNDLRLSGELAPKKHVLIAGKGKRFELNLNGLVSGDVYSGQSRLNFSDLIAHNLLPRKGKSFTYPVTAGRKGALQVGDAKISFQCSEVVEKKVPAMPGFKGYSWLYATWRGLGDDLLFKVILLLVIIGQTALLGYMSGLPTELPRDVNARRVVPQRLARLIVNKTNIDIEDIRGGRKISENESEEEKTPEKKEGDGGKPEKSKKTVKPESMGVLGLLTGSGSSGQSNDLADFLLDKGLAAELDEVISSADLSLGQGNDNRSDDLDLNNLIAQSAGGGIDDLLGTGGDDNIGTASFGKRGKIEVDRIGGMTGSATALGQRSEESVRLVLQRNTGRLTYIYNKYLKDNPDFRGKILVEVVIAANGSVSDIKLIESSMGNKDFEREVVSYVRRWKYAPIKQGSVTVSYPLFFSRI